MTPPAPRAGECQHEWVTGLGGLGIVCRFCNVPIQDALTDARTALAEIAGALDVSAEQWEQLALLEDDPVDRDIFRDYARRARTILTTHAVAIRGAT